MSKHLIVPGASRSGTTFLHGILSQHPELNVPEKKELRFFERDFEYSQGLEYYFSHFNERSEDLMHLDISPPYFHAGILQDKDGAHRFDLDNDAISRIKNDLEEVNVLISLRNPVHRLYSQYHKNFFKGHEKETLENALMEELQGKRTPKNTPCCWIYKNTYSVHLKKWMSLFPNAKVILFEEWTQDPNTKINEVVSSFGLEKFNFETDQLKTNEGSQYTTTWKRSKWYRKFFNKSYGKITEKEYSLIYELIKDDMKVVEELINTSIEVWNK